MREEPWASLSSLSPSGLLLHASVPEPQGARQIVSEVHADPSPETQKDREGAWRVQWKIPAQRRSESDQCLEGKLS